MPFESGSVSLRAYKLPQPFPDDIADAFAEHAIPDLEKVKMETVYGWASGRHLLDAEITSETVRMGGWIRLNLVEIQRKIPPSLLKAESRKEEFIRMKMDNRPFLTRKEKAEIRQGVEARLMPQMPPQLKAIALLHEPGTSFLYSDAVAPKQSDLFIQHVRHATGVTPLPLVPDIAGSQLFSTDVRDWMPSSFSEKVEDGRVSNEAGFDFLTWLWYESEAGQGVLELEEMGPVQILVEGPLKFVMEGSGAYETLLRKGQPVVSSEARACLIGGKKLSACKLSLVSGEDVWQGNFDALEFTARSLKLPDTEDNLDHTGRINFRMEQINRYRTMLYGLFGQFLVIRKNPKKWSVTKEAMREWVTARAAVY